MEFAVRELVEFAVQEILEFVCLKKIDSKLFLGINPDFTIQNFSAISKKFSALRHTRFARAQFRQISREATHFAEFFDLRLVIISADFVKFGGILRRAT